ncbi:MAG: aldo/keto reductase [Proteobacteria bacterium]|nr:aldo/keto reductase [Pseudomonadota bacterium]
MKTRTLGKTGLVVSEVGFGGIPIIPLSEEDAISTVRYCYAQKITFFDTANMYGDSEKKIGAALRDVRNKVVYATKTLARDAMTAASHIDTSLLNLKTDVIDLYQLHNVSKQEDIDNIFAAGGALEAIQQAKSQGKISHIGFSSHDLKTAIQMCRTDLFSTVQFPFNFIEKEPADELFKVAEKLDMGIIAMKPLGGGLLDRADLCFKFLQLYPNVLPIPGVQSREELDQILELYRSPSPLTAKDKKEIDDIRSQLGKRFCHRCGYCMPCAQGVNITEVMMFPSLNRRLARDIALLFAEKAMATVDNCTECGECVEKCAYSLPVPEMLRDYKVMFDELKSRPVA